MKTIILYQTKTGSTKQYAQWLSERIKNSELLDIHNYRKESVEKYDRVVIGSRTYMGKIQAQDFMEKHWEEIKDKDVHLFAVGIFPQNSPESKASFEQIPQYIRDGLTGYVKLPGKIQLKELNFFDKLIFRLMKIEEQDLVDKKNIKQIEETL